MAGIDKVADTISPTLGVRGKNVVLDTNPFTDPVITNDGVTIARELVLEDPFENAGAKLIREVSSKTNDNAGDGTTTAAVLMRAIVAEGLKAISAGSDAVQIRRGIEAATKEIIKRIKEGAVKAEGLETLTSIATISSGSPDLGEMVAKIVNETGADGMINIEDNDLPTGTVEKLEGLKLRGGFQHPVFVTSPEAQQAMLKDVPIVVTNQNITLAHEMGKIMEAAQVDGKKEVVIIANSIESDAMATAVLNWHQKRMRALPIKVSAFGETGEGILRDVAAITGARFIDHNEGMKILSDDPETSFKPDDLGQASKIVATKDETTIISNDQKAKKSRVKELKALSEAKSTKEFERESLKERIAKLQSIMFTIKVGAPTDTERGELKLRVEDAVNATKAALEDGVVSGGGSALYRAQAEPHGTIAKGEHAGEEANGYYILLGACRKPLLQMAENVSAELDRSDFEAIQQDSKKAIDFTDGKVVDSFEKGIVDPAKVVIEAIKNAASGAALFLTTEASVVVPEEPKEEKI